MKIHCRKLEMLTHRVPHSFNILQVPYLNVTALFTLISVKLPTPNPTLYLLGMGSTGYSSLEDDSPP